MKTTKRIFLGMALMASVWHSEVYGQWSTSTTANLVTTFSPVVGNTTGTNFFGIGSGGNNSQSGTALRYNNYLELGYGLAKGIDWPQGMIAYRKFSEGLDIVGIGDGGSNWITRKITMHAAAGTKFNGGIDIVTVVNGSATGFGYLNVDADTRIGTTSLGVNLPGSKLSFSQDNGDATFLQRFSGASTENTVLRVNVGDDGGIATNSDRFEVGSTYGSGFTPAFSVVTTGDVTISRHGYIGTDLSNQNVANIFRSVLYFSPASDNNDPMYFQRYNQANNISVMRLCIGDDGAASTNADLFEVGSYDIAANQTGWRKALTVRADGVVNIGNTLPPVAEIGFYKLAVNGRILATEVKVIAPNGWSDYVFEKDYKLTSLPEVEQYTLLNKHLPGIPSAEEILSKGYDVSSMDSKLLAKIEELYLHVIQLEKLVAAQKSQLEELNKK